MKLATKLVSTLVVALVALLVLESFISIQRNMQVFENDMQRDVNQLGRTLKSLTEDVWRSKGKQRAIELVEQANDEEKLVSVRLVWLDQEANKDYQPQIARERLIPVLAGESLILRQRTSDGPDFLCSYFPLEIEGSRPAALEISKSLDGLDRFRRETIIRAALLVLGFVVSGVLIVSVLGFVLIGRPLDRLIDKTRRVGAGDLSGPIVLHGRGELTELAAAVNKMCEDLGDARSELAMETEARIAAIEQLRHADRLATLGRLAAGVAHELGTPMNVTSARATMVLEKEDVDESARVIKTQIEKMTSIIRQLLDFARKQPPKKAEHSVSQLVTQVADIFAATVRKHKIEIRITHYEEGLSAWVDEGPFQQVTTNLIENAIHAMPTGGQIEIRLGRVDTQPPAGSNAASGPYIRMDVQDQGVGIDAITLKHVFDPFFTTKDVGEGTGLGLSIVYGIVRDHGGWVDVQSEQGKGSCFSVYLPIEGVSCQDES